MLLVIVSYVSHAVLASLTEKYNRVHTILVMQVPTIIVWCAAPKIMGKLHMFTLAYV